MTEYTYKGEPDLYYPELALTPEPGKSYPLPLYPLDGRWTSTDTAVPEPAPTQETN